MGKTLTPALQRPQRSTRASISLNLSRVNLLASPTTDACGMTKALCLAKPSFLISKPRNIHGLWMAHANGLLVTIGFTQ
jgi:hypothetical protein